ncbi:MAG: bifunctional transcriptional activator/DNA repair protein Ada [Defluviimonas sp.]|nr:bifunctional transcriptional activator/DNA repair protein Ada [Paracoccaceae bacterium]MCC0063584.1 bifunctional transcriptional activator/DNA repair protein Ada [Defluviimonas sp.]
MMFDLPDDDTLYAALLARDPRYDGRAFVAVASTGIFCRLTCPAPKPLRRNCHFFDSAAACAAEGFRPCRRCHPLGSTEPFVAELLEALQADPARRWSEAALAARGLDPSTVRRAFRRHFAMTFLDMARAARLRAGFGTLKDGGRVIEAQLEAGFASGSGFRAAFARLLGRAPGAFTGREMLKADWLDTPLGGMIAVSDARALHLLEFADRKALPTELKRLSALVKGDIGIGRTAQTDRIETELGAYFAGRSARFETPLALHGTAFTRAVWDLLRAIPPGATRSYSEIALALGRPQAVRAVARANGANQIAIAIPCHRVIGADGSLTGYGGGLWRKERLIALERSCSQGTARESRRTPALPATP